MKKEYRHLPEAITVREEDQEKRIIEGYFAKFDRWFHGPFFKEKIAPGAFTRTLKERDIIALWNHDDSKPLGRTGNNTLRLMEDDKGLWGQIDVVDTTWGRDALISVRSGNVSGASFGFEVDKDGEEWNQEFTERILRKLKLREVSPVTFPAYNTTNVSARSVLDAIGRPVADVLPRLVERSLSGRITSEERRMFEAIMSQNQAVADVDVEEEPPVYAMPPHMIQDLEHSNSNTQEPDPALADRKRLVEARCVITFDKLQKLGVIKPH